MSKTSERVVEDYEELSTTFALLLSFIWIAWLSLYFLTVITYIDLADHQPCHNLYVFIRTSHKGQKAEQNCERTARVGVLKMDRAAESSPPKVWVIDGPI